MLQIGCNRPILGGKRSQPVWEDSIKNDAIEERLVVLDQTRIDGALSAGFHVEVDLFGLDLDALDF